MISIQRILTIFILGIFININVVTMILSDAHAVTGKTKSANPRAKQRKVLYAPTGYDRVGVIVNKGKEYKYYIFSRETPLKLELEGTTTLEVKVRLLYDVTMKGTQNFTVAIEQEGILGTRSQVASYSFTAEKSRISSLQGENGVVPSKAHGFKLVVPDGKHQYVITLRSTTAKSAAIRILIPKRDIKPVKK